MTSHKTNVATIVEASSETEQISSEEILLSESRHHVKKNATLDDLFAELKQESSSNKIKESQDEFQEIRRKINNLPRIESHLEAKLSNGLDSNLKNANLGLKKGEKIARINDPIAVKIALKTTTKEDAGSKWFHMKQQEITPELRRDLMVIKQRAALDPKRHYKKDKWEIPKYFETGRIIQGNTEFYSSRMNKRDRGRTLVEEVLNDQDTSKYFKRVYSDIQDKRTSGRKGHYKKVKAMRKKF